MGLTNSEPPVGRSPAASPFRAVDDPRIYLAAERTFLAWIRTSLALMGFGFLIARFALLIREFEANEVHSIHARPQFSSLLGFGMVCVGVTVCIIAALRHRDYIAALRQGVANPDLNIKTSLILAGTLAAAGMAVAIHVLTL